MKKILLLLVFVAQISVAQSYKILSSAAGTLESFEFLSENDELYGYAELRKIDMKDPLTIKYKYIILDKNMNTICSGEFNENLQKKKCYKKNYQIIYNNGHVIFTFREGFDNGKGGMSIRCHYKILNLASNSIVADKDFDPTATQDLSIPKLSGKFKMFSVSALSDTGFLVTESALEAGYASMSFAGDIIWDQTLKAEAKKEEFHYSLFDKSDDIVTLLATKMKSGRKVSDHLLVLDARTGKEISFTDMFNNDYTLRFSFSDYTDGIMTVVGRYFKKNKRDNVDSEESLGLYRRIVDVKSGKIVSDTFLPYLQFKDSGISEYGKIKGEGMLAIRDIDKNPDGTFLIVAETYRNKSSIDLFTELYTFIVNKDFTSVDAKSFDTEKSRGSKYSFSQKLPNKQGKVYFFYDKDDAKKIELNMINFTYKDNAVTVNKMSLDNPESRIQVYPAKTGYIAIREFFKESKKNDKTMEIRLEKLNYER